MACSPSPGALQNNTFTATCTTRGSPAVVMVPNAADPDTPLGLPSGGVLVTLKTSAEFESVYENGAKRSSRSFVLFALPNGLGHYRFGLTTSRKLGKAHERNRIRRRVREILRTSQPSTKAGFDVVVNPRRSVQERDFQELRSELLTLLGADI